MKEMTKEEPWYDPRDRVLEATDLAGTIGHRIAAGSGERDGTRRSTMTKLDNLGRTPLSRRRLIGTTTGLAGYAAGRALGVHPAAAAGMVQDAAARGGTVTIVEETFGQESWLVNKSATITTGPQQPLYEWLLYYDPNNTFELKPGLAESWSHMDFKEFTFKIREGVQWDQGQGEVTAEDVAFTLQLIARDDARSTDTPYWRPRVGNMEVVDRYTLRFSFDTVEPVLAYHLSNWRRTQIMSQAYIESVGEEEADRSPVGSGPYRLDEYAQGSRVELVPVDHPHWRVDPEGEFADPDLRVSLWDRMVFLNVAESSTRMAMLDTERGDLVQSDIEQLEDATGKGYDIFTTEAVSQVAFMFGGLFRDTHPNFQGEDPWQDIRVREAMAIAIDRQAINEALFGGLGTFEPTPGNNVAPLSTVANLPMPYDPERARQLLQEAGQEGFSPTIISYTYPGIPQMSQLVEAVASYWQEIGLNPEIQPMDRLAFREIWLADETSGLIWPWGNPVQPLFEARMEKFFYSEDIGFQIYTDEHMDQVFTDLSAITDPETRATTLADAQIYLREQWAAMSVLNVPSMIYAALPGKIAAWSPMRAGESTTWEYVTPGPAS